jgi:hypothetical protein
MILNDDQIIHTKGFDKKMMQKVKDTKGLCILGWKDDVNDDRLSPSFATKEFLEFVDGWYYPMPTRHLYGDNMYDFIGRACDIFYYLENVYIEHRHPSNGKAKVDASYEQSNSQARYDQDGKVYASWLDKYAIELCEKVLEAKGDKDIPKKLKAIRKKIDKMIKK